MELGKIRAPSQRFREGTTYRCFEAEKGTIGIGLEKILTLK